jgi:hypothetical protein
MIREIIAAQEAITCCPSINIHGQRRKTFSKSAEFPWKKPRRGISSDVARDGRSATTADAYRTHERIYVYMPGANKRAAIKYAMPAPIFPVTAVAATYKGTDRGVTGAKYSTTLVIKGASLDFWSISL